MDKGGIFQFHLRRTEGRAFGGEIGEEGANPPVTVETKNCSQGQGCRLSARDVRPAIIGAWTSKHSSRACSVGVGWSHNLPGRLGFPRSLSDGDSVIFEPVHSDTGAKSLLGPELLQSKYKLLQAPMSATPDRVKWWRFRSSQNKRAALLLFIKFAALTEFNPMHSLAVRPIYTIASGEFRGLSSETRTDHLTTPTSICLMALLAASLSMSVGSMDMDKC